ncbi:uncharacterized protein ACA1_385580 [Acanthamoeba castellanii str. Neff]|uniref:MYND-type domain-containing protein n=1 Tax=Acanthamoeba castellanii (strain ATCC 30010 / Neff) TaxID=1257118 RepID=L8HBJ8_ACACF|nr:uncharacterized protein ACA1_385580 [Acanthamoeba castellanii str. Neff]ELR21781.1 hypothetical protein ACA1_385580 [Acanthamoeba castellanii str. Neff]
MTRLVPNSHMGWHCRGWAAEEYGAMAKGAVKATADDDKEHKVTFLYRYIDCIRRGHFRMGDMRKLYMEARQLEKDIRPLGLRHHSEEKATVKHLMKSTPASEDHRVCKKGLVNVSYSSEEEYQRKVAAMELEAQLRGRDLILHKDMPRGVEEFVSPGAFYKVLRCSRCKTAKNVCACQKQNWPTHKKNCKAPAKPAAP